MENIFNIIIEGPDGVGKSSLITGLFKHYNFRYMCYHRGDMSNFVFAKKYGRPFFATQLHLPLIYIYLTADKSVLKDRIVKRAKEGNWSEEAFKEEVEKLDDVDLFEDAYQKLRPDYIINRIDTSYLSQEQTLEAAVKILDDYQKEMFAEADKEISSWNKMYDKICKELDIDFKVFKNQPYINGRPVMVESTLHNGEYETYDNKTCYDNTLYAMAYDIDKSVIASTKKVYDFNYIINSKIKRRLEVFDYYLSFVKHNKSCMVTGRQGILDIKLKNTYPHNLIRQKDVSGNDYLYNIAKSKATVYACRDLAGFELQTGRLYEAILADNVVFFDELTDKEHKILKLIYGNAPTIIDSLVVTPDNICDKYDKIMKDEKLVNFILTKQHEFLERQFEEAKDFYRKDRKW